MPERKMLEVRSGRPARRKPKEDDRQARSEERHGNGQSAAAQPDAKAED